MWNIIMNEETGGLEIYDEQGCLITRCETRQEMVVLITALVEVRNHFASEPLDEDIPEVSLAYY